MFDPEKEVPSLELCEKLKELGYPQDKYGFYWIKLEAQDKYDLSYWNKKEIRWSEKGDYILVGGCGCCADIFDIVDKIKAPTVRELGEWLPCYLPELKFLHIERNEDGFHYYYDEKTFDGAYVIADTEANARAQMLIWLAENGYVKFGEQK